jgi:hypothetical protein
MSIGSDTARLGYRHEQLFTDLINKNSIFNKHISDFLGIIIPLEAVNVKGREKSDVNLYFGNTIVGCSLKSAKANFNQLDRRWLEDWVDVLDMPDYIVKHIQHGLDSMSKNSHNAKLIQNEYEEEIITFVRIKIDNLLIELFTRGDSKVKIFIT